MDKRFQIKLENNEEFYYLNNIKLPLIVMTAILPVPGTSVKHRAALHFQHGVGRKQDTATSNSKTHIIETSYFNYFF